MEEDLTEPTAPTAVAIAKRIAEFFPEVASRSFAITGLGISKEHVPVLPTCVVALLKDSSSGSWASTSPMEIKERFLVTFFVEPKRIKIRHKNTANLIDSPYFAFYNYETIRDGLIAAFNGWLSPREVGIDFRDFEIETLAFAVALSFTFEHTFYLCDESEDSGVPIDLRFALTMGAGACCADEEEEKDPCP